MAGVSKQAVHQHNQRKGEKADATHKFFGQADILRKAHPGVGCRQLAMKIRIKAWGRDKVEKLLLEGGFRIVYPPNYRRTTYSQSEFIHPNLIEGKEINDVNKVVQTDTTYYRVKNCFYYITFFIDLYSRYIPGYAVSKSLKAEANSSALKMLIRKRKPPPGLIHHSDRARQYTDKQYRKLIKDHQFVFSMCTEAWENAYSERINKTIKTEYLDGWEIKSYKSLVKRTQMAVDHYNNQREHSSLNKQTPAAFERQLKTIPEQERTVQKIYKKQSSL